MHESNGQRSVVHLKVPRLVLEGRCSNGEVGPNKPLQNLLVDLEQVEFIGSIGFLVFVGLRRVLSKGRIVLCCPRAPVQDAFLACRLISAEPGGAAPFDVAADVAQGAALVTS